MRSLQGADSDCWHLPLVTGSGPRFFCQPKTRIISVSIQNWILRSKQVLTLQLATWVFFFLRWPFSFNLYFFKKETKEPYLGSQWASLLHPSRGQEQILGCGEKKKSVNYVGFWCSKWLAIFGGLLMDFCGGFFLLASPHHLKRKLIFAKNIHTHYHLDFYTISYWQEYRFHCAL